jgi:outer membrane receptor protein involved in Fe transport
MRRFGKLRGSLLAAAMMGTLTLASPLRSQEQPRQEYSLDAQDLPDALRAVSRQSGQEIMFSDEAVAGRHAPRLHGSFTAQEAVRALLAGSDLIADFTPDAIVIRGRSEPPREIADRPVEDGAIFITGSRIAGSIATSPMIILSQRDLSSAGFTNLGDVIRSIPQNYTGGQNPTVAGGGIQGAANQNTTSSSSFNLRGLGPDATLTLLNGHRMPSDGVFQGIDISAIPLAAINRIEVVTDGSSAIYGSDAVAGVANVLLKRSFDGIETSARIGTSTDGGNRQVQLGAVGGLEWRGGGVMSTFDFSRQTAILAGDRHYTQSMHPSQTLVPNLKQYSGILTGYQRLGSSIRFEMDATYNHRGSSIQTPTTSAASYLASGSHSQLNVESFSVSPTLRVELSSAWEAYLMGTYGESRAFLHSSLFSAGARYFDVQVDYNNSLKTAETGVNGPIASLPGGPLKLALGGGYRSNMLDTLVRSGGGGKLQTTMDFTRGRDSWYGFGELNAPIVGPDNGLPLVRRLIVSTAVRYEDYPEVGAVLTPKVGLLYSPLEIIDFTASWGRSFKAPTLYQQFQNKGTVLRAATAYGTSDFPAGSTVLGLSGGNADSLKPEHADNLTISAGLRPAFLAGLHIELSYYKIRYRDRIVAPIPSNLGLFSNPLYASFVTYSPTAAQLAAALANAPAGLTNAAGVPYDPAKVVAIVDNRQHNSARQEIAGLDLSLRYGFAAGQGRFNLLADASYLESRQVLVDGQPAVDLAGTLYNAPHWRARGGLQWERAGLTASSYVNFTGGTHDRRILPERPVASFATIDAALTYRFLRDGSIFNRLEILLSATNLLNAAPSRIRQSSTIEPTYDSTNYSSVGRFVSLSLRKQW